MPSSLLKFVKTLSVKIGGRRYPVVQIGNQLWMAENLDYKFDVNGSQIPIGQSGSPTTPAAWYYNNDEASYGIDGTYKCGLLYNWYAVKYLDDNKDTLLPNGWHVPTSTEFDTLATTVGGVSVAGTKLKASDVSWASSWGGTDNYGFAALPTGRRDSSSFYYLSSRANWWTATEDTSTSAYSRTFDLSAQMYSFSNDKDLKAFSLRLVKNVT